MIIRAPFALNHKVQSIPNRIFLAGSIEMGKAVDWQTRLEQELGVRDDVLVMNPRRLDWDSSWVQEAANPQFSEQVNWELDALNLATDIAMYFDPATKSPISLLELGLHADSGKMVVCCPPGFWRKGNVDIVCARYSIEMVQTLDELIKAVKDNLV